MLSRITHEDIPVGLAEAVHRQTEGNPLFVQEVVRYLTEEKLLVTSGGKMKTSDITRIEMNIPEGLRDVIGKRLTNLSEECNKVLSVAAVIGREFRLDVLEKVAGITEEEVYNALEEAKGAAIVEERSAVGVAITYRFAHAFFRQTLYEEIIAPRRIRLHQQVAQTLEFIYKNRLSDHAAELAEHFSYSPDLEDLGKAVNYGEMAANRATDVYDFGEAVRLLERALKVQEVFAPDDKEKQCDLLISLCEALFAAPDLSRVKKEAEPAFQLAENLGDNSRAAHVCLVVIRSILGEQMNLEAPEAGEWVERIDRVAKLGTVERIYADYALGIRKFQTGEQESGLSLLEQAVDMARSIGDWKTFWSVAPTIIV
jgi:predicted ATPase